MSFRAVVGGLFFILSVFAINSCEKEQTDTDTQSSVDNSIAEGEFCRVFSQTHGIAVNNSGVQRNSVDIPIPAGGCPDYYVDSLDATAFPVTLWLYFGTDTDGDGIYETGCTGNDGKVRQGMIEAVFDKPWHLPGSGLTMTLHNYYVNGIKFEATISVSKTLTSYTQTVQNGKASKGSEWSILWNSTRTLTADIGVPSNPFDDVLTVTGTANGTDRNGKTFSVDIDANNPLISKMGCPYIVKGRQTVKIQGKTDRVIDYGDGTCDNIAKIIINGNEFEFKLQ